MVNIGIVCEYNPFHNGHVYHINEIKKLYPDSRIILVMSGNFIQRGDVSIINKWDKTRIALNHGVDLVIELPFVFATQGADKFAHGAVEILDALGVDKLVFGSECNDIDLLRSLANIQVNNKNYDVLVKNYIDNGVNYPTAMSNALKDCGGVNISSPNDILGLCYIKEIIRLNSSIEPVSIERTCDYHDSSINGNICSASAIRLSLKKGDDISNYVPTDSYNYINNCSISDLYGLIKYKIMTCDDLCSFVTVDDKIMYSLKKNIYSCDNFESFISSVKSKRYTYNRIKRMLLHILCDFTVSENSQCADIHYIRVMGFNSIGRDFLNEIKKNCNVPIISNFSGLRDIMLDIEFRSTCIYSLIFNNSNDIISSEYKNKPIIK